MQRWAEPGGLHTVHGVSKSRTRLSNNNIERFVLLILTMRIAQLSPHFTDEKVEEQRCYGNELMPEMF